MPPQLSTDKRTLNIDEKPILLRRVCRPFSSSRHLNCASIRLYIVGKLQIRLSRWPCVSCAPVVLVKMGLWKHGKTSQFIFLGLLFQSQLVNKNTLRTIVHGSFYITKKDSRQRPSVAVRLPKQLICN